MRVSVGIEAGPHPLPASMRSLAGILLPTVITTTMLGACMSATLDREHPDPSPSAPPLVETVSELPSGPIPCTTREHVYFACEIPGGNWVALCGTEDLERADAYLSYRHSAIGAGFPGSGMGLADFGYAALDEAGRIGHRVFVDNRRAMMRYVFEVARAPSDQDPVGVVRHLDRQGQVAFAPCVAPPYSELGSLAEHLGAPG